MRNKKTLFIIAFFGLFLLLYYIVKKMKEKASKGEKKPLVVVDDVEQFRVDEQGNILVFQNGEWVIQA